MTEIRCPIEYCKNNKFQEKFGMGICQAPVLPLDTEEVYSEDEADEPETMFRCLAFVNKKSKEEPPKFAPTLEEESKRFGEAIKKELASGSGNETNKPRHEPAGHGVNSVSSASGPELALEECP
jgi:hypothetical protein